MARQSRLGRSAKAVHQCRGIGEFRYAPSTLPSIDEALRDRCQSGDDVGRRDANAGVAAGQQHSDRLAGHVSTDVGAEAGDVAAAVVDAEPEPAGQCGQRRLAPGSRRPARCTQSRTSAWPPMRPDSGEATMLRTRS